MPMIRLATRTFMPAFCSGMSPLDAAFEHNSTEVANLLQLHGVSVVITHRFRLCL